MRPTFAINTESLKMLHIAQKTKNKNCQSSPRWSSAHLRASSYQRSQKSICPNSPHPCCDSTHVVLCKAKEMAYSKSLICPSMLHCKTKPLFRSDNSQVPAHGTIRYSVCQSPKREVHPPTAPPQNSHSSLVPIGSFLHLPAPGCSTRSFGTLIASIILKRCWMSRKEVQPVQNGENTKFVLATLC